MQYLTVENLTKSFGVRTLFQNITFNIEEGDKVALVAKNGTGKSSLLKIIAGLDTPDSGKVWVHKDVKVVFLNQEANLNPNQTVTECIFEHDHPILNAIRDYEAIIHDPNADPDKLTDALSAMDTCSAWDFEAKVEQILTRLKVDIKDQKIESLSGGQQKRVALAKVLLDIGFNNQQCLLIMDEPTNHLDVDMIEWLEEYLKKERVTLLLVTHDRYFLDRVCNEIIEIDQQKIYTYKGDYEDYLFEKATRQDQEQASVDKAQNLMRKELDWMRRQPKARTTKSKSRIDAFYELEAKAKGKKVDTGLELNMKMTRMGKKIIELEKVSKAFGEKVILKDFTYVFKRGEKVGIVGDNGAGKSTFLKILLNEVQPDSGKIETGETIVFGNFSQQGLVVKEDKRVIEFVTDIAEYFPLADGSRLSASQFLLKFLFTPEQQYSMISKLSGGEKKRLHLLSVLFKNPNFLILDEPTNDLDLPTLAVLEDFLAEFPGCLIIVSHDRYFMDRLVDHLLVFKGAGEVLEYNGLYSEYRTSLLQKTETPAPKKVEAQLEEKPKIETPKKKLSFKETQELNQLETDIAKLEDEKSKLQNELESGKLGFDVLEKHTQRIGEIISLLEEKELRWLELSESV